MAVALPLLLISCGDNNDEPETSDKHEYVDLGLPSGTLWASRIPQHPGGGATNSMNDTGVSIVSFRCSRLLSKLKLSHKKMKRLRLAS